jgi:hypothetical protein
MRSRIAMTNLNAVRDQKREALDKRKKRIEEGSLGGLRIQIDRDPMARFRPEMRKYYYDASKYETYLDQLGVKFPTLAKTQ